MTVKLAATIGAVLAASPGSPRRRKTRSPAGLSFIGRVGLTLSELLKKRAEPEPESWRATPLGIDIVKPRPLKNLRCALPALGL
jgi:hypothetical protein